MANAYICSKLMRTKKCQTTGPESNPKDIHLTLVKRVKFQK